MPEAAPSQRGYWIWHDFTVHKFGYSKSEMGLKVR